MLAARRTDEAALADWTQRLPADGSEIAVRVDGFSVHARRAGGAMALRAVLGDAPADEAELRRLMRRTLAVAEEGGGALGLDGEGRLVLHAAAVRDAAALAAFLDAAADWRRALAAPPPAAALPSTMFIRP